ncbi:Acidic phosphoprotein precursor PCEMA1, putative [Plasmodium chabaudi adami]|uniref:Acidic phosphoprotein PCEMA1, putative n=1 Tax=Plasmodium chabaudi adami TaxID=5826 RepID=A0A1C6WPD7_PLACE|nr:Acidic phosphoprotein precursor PCEMA1, putative [Plasmodium chabaudi adami]
MNKFYIQIVFFLLSVSVYLNNTTLAAESVPGKATTSKSINSYPTLEETINAGKFMNEAVLHLIYHVMHGNDYKPCKIDCGPGMSLYKKKEGRTDIKKVYYSVNDSDKYNEIINDIWDPNTPNNFNTGTVKIVRVYNPNLVMIQQRYEEDSKGCQKYFYALAKKIQISEDATVIAMASADINDHNPYNKEYKNEIIENAKLFKTSVDPEDDIINGKLKKTFVNVAGYFIQKFNRRVDIAYVESINGHSSF